MDTRETLRAGASLGDTERSYATRSLARRSGEASRMLVATRVVMLALAGYMLFDRAFAWIHIPGTPLFVGELTLVIGLGIVLRSRQLVPFLRKSRPMQLLGIFMLWGALFTVAGFGEYGLDAIRDAAIWYYGLFAIVAGTIYLAFPQALDHMRHGYAKLIPIYILGVGWLRLAFAGKDNDPANISIFVPDSDVGIIAHKTGNIAVHAVMGVVFLLVMVVPALRSARIKNRIGTRTALMLLAGLLMLLAAGTQTRGGLLAGIFILPILALLHKSSRPFLAGATVLLIGAVVIAYSADVRIELQRRELSVRQLFANLDSIGAGGDEAADRTAQSTAAWRVELWKNVFDDVTREDRLLSGFGFGENLADRYGAADLRQGEDLALRNPHNSHLSILARMGVVGAALWVLIWAVWFRQLIRARHRLRMMDRDSHADLLLFFMLSIVAIMINAFFDPTLEGPQVGAWTWTIFGLGAAIALEANRPVWRRRYPLAADDAGNEPDEVEDESEEDLVRTPIRTRTRRPL